METTKDIFSEKLTQAETKSHEIMRLVEAYSKHPIDRIIILSMISMHCELNTTYLMNAVKNHESNHPGLFQILTKIREHILTQKDISYKDTNNNAYDYSELINGNLKKVNK